MDTNIILVYCLCDDLLKWQHHRDDPQCVLSDAEIMTIAIVAAMYFSGNQAMARLLLYEQGYIKESISRSRLCRRRLCRRLKRVQHPFVTLFRCWATAPKSATKTTSNRWQVGLNNFLWQCLRERLAGGAALFQL